MKKLFVGLVAAICCIAFVAPAFAEVKVEGMIQTDFYYWDVSKEQIIGGLAKGTTTLQDDWSTTRINMPQPLNRITVRYTGEDKVVNGYIQIRAGGSRANPSSAAAMNAGVNSESAFSWEYSWIDWHVNPNLYFRFGRQDQTFAGAYAPAQGMGQVDGHIIGLGFGNVTAQSRDAIRAFIKFNQNIRMEIELLDPNTETAGNTELNIPAIAGTAAANARESNVWPRFDWSLPMQFGNFKIEPGFTYLKQEYDQVFSGSDDGYDIWGVTLGAAAGFGPFSIAGEVTYGENLAPYSSHFGASLGAPAAYNPAGTNANVRKIEDGETLAWWVQLGFDFGPFAIQGIVGAQKGENDGDPTIARDAAEFEITQWMYGLNFPIKVTKTFTITPAIWYYDYDDDAKVGTISTTVDVDRGDQLMVGVTFQLVF
ncbi:MAG: hypothetical protein AB1512_29560 [Thermodesulfobacteriota bacterium]